MSTASDQGPSGWRDPARWLLVMLGLATALSLALCIARCAVLADPLDLFSTSGGEGIAVYTVWKAAHGYPVYQMPGAGLYDSAFYNFLFYKGYGAFVALLGLDGERLLIATRLLTCCSGLLGAFAQWRVLGLLLPGPFSGRERWVLATMVALTWYGASFMNWWLVTARPDVPAVACAMLGLWLALLALRRGSPWLAALAALPFYGAWALKQSVVWTLTGAVAGAWLARARRPALVLAVGAGAAFAATLALGGATYRYDTLYLPSLNPIVPRDSFTRFHQLLPPLLLFWLFALLPALLAVARRRWPAAPTLLAAQGAEQAQAQRVVALAGAIAVALGIVAIGKEGSGRNHMMEGMVLVSTLAAANLVRLLRAAPGRARCVWLGIAAVLALVLCGRPNNSLFLDTTGITRGAASDIAEHRALRSALAGLPKPAFVADDMLDLPWHANGNHFPGHVPDMLTYATIRKHGLVTDNGLGYLITHGDINALLLPRPREGRSLEDAQRDPLWDLVSAADHAGFREAPMPPELKGWVALVRPGAP
jgi:hypothetical protein